MEFEDPKGGIAGDHPNRWGKPISGEKFIDPWRCWKSKSGLRDFNPCPAAQRGLLPQSFRWWERVIKRQNKKSIQRISFDNQSKDDYEVNFRIF